MSTRLAPGLATAAWAVLAVLPVWAGSCLSKPPALPCDADGDGFSVAACGLAGPADCDDVAANVFPGQREVCGDTVDDDCSGEVLHCEDALPTLSVDETGANTKITGIGLYTLELDPEQSYAPVVLRRSRASGQNLLFTSTLMNERLIGISHWDNWFSWRDTQPPEFERLVQNDVVVRLRIGWTSADDADSLGMSGTSIYTVFPDGRIHRDEDTKVLFERQSNDYLTAYIGLNPEHINRIDWASNAQEPHVVDGNLGGICCGAAETPSYLCAYHTETGDRVGWAHRLAAAPADAGARATESQRDVAATHQVALQYDFVRGAIIATGDYQVNVMLQVGEIDNDNDNDECDGIFRHSAGFHQPASLTVTAPGSVVVDGVLDSPGDDDEDGYNEGGGFYQVSAGGGSSVEIVVTRNAPIQAPSYVFRIDDLDLSGPSWVELGDARLEHGSDYLLTGDTSGGWLLVAAELPDASTLRVSTLAAR